MRAVRDSRRSAGRPDASAESASGASDDHGRSDVRSAVAWQDVFARVHARSSAGCSSSSGGGGGSGDDSSLSEGSEARRGWHSGAVPLVEEPFNGARAARKAPAQVQTVKRPRSPPGEIQQQRGLEPTASTARRVAERGVDAQRRSAEVLGVLEPGFEAEVAELEAEVAAARAPSKKTRKQRKASHTAQAPANVPADVGHGQNEGRHVRAAARPLVSYLAVLGDGHESAAAFRRCPE